MNRNSERQLIGSNIKQQRTRVGISVVDAASQIGIDRTYWHQIENGNANASMDKYEKIAKLLGVTVRELFTESQDSNPKQRPKKSKRRAA